MREQPATIVPNVQQSRREMTTSRPPAADDFFADDDLLLGIDLDANILSGDDDAPAPPAVASGVDAVEQCFFDDDDEDMLFVKPELLQFDSTAASDESSPKNAESKMNLMESVAYDEMTEMDSIAESVQQSILVDSTAIENTPPQSAELLIKSEPKPLSGGSFLDADYKFKMRGLSLVTIDQLIACDAAAKRGQCFIVKCEIDSVYEKLRVSRGKWSIGAHIRDMSANMLKVSY